jgi:hypothetical protein
MSYDLHVVRTENWLDASEMPISKQDVDALIRDDSELEWSKDDYVDMKDEKGVITRYFLINWKSSPCFWWYRDQIRCSNPDKAQQIKLIKIAHLLHAYAIGDDHERYEVRRNIFGREKVIIVNPDDS